MSRFAFAFAFLLLAASAYAQPPGGKISTRNSSLTLLADGATFTGSGEGTLSFSSFFVFVDTDADGTLYVDFSSDGTNWDRTKPVIVDQTDGSGSTHGFAVASPYMRVRYTDASDGTEQTHFRLQTTFVDGGQPFLGSSPNQRLSRSNDVQLVRIANDPAIDVARGLWSDKYAESKFGYNPNVGTGAFEHICASSGDISWMTTAATFRVKAGGNAADTAAGDGCREVTLTYIDTSWEEQTEALETAGESASSATSATGFRVQRAWCSASGVYGAANTAAVTIEETGSNTTQALILASIGQTEKTQYTVPAGHRAIVRSVCWEIEAAKPVELQLWQRQDADDATAPVKAPRIVRRVASAVGSDCVQFAALKVFPEKTDLWLSAKASAGGGAVAVNATFDMKIIRGDTVVVPQ